MTIAQQIAAAFAAWKPQREQYAFDENQHPRDATGEFSLKREKAKPGTAKKTQQPLFAGFEPETPTEKRAREAKKPIAGQKSLFGDDAPPPGPKPKRDSMVQDQIDARDDIDAEEWLYKAETKAVKGNARLKALSDRAAKAVHKHFDENPDDESEWTRLPEEMEFNRALVAHLEQSGDEIPPEVRGYLQRRDKDRFARLVSDAVERYAERWITIGAHGEGKDRHGGTPVKLDGKGRIVAGPDHMQGKTVKKLVADSQPKNRTEGAIHEHAAKHRIARSELSAAVDQVHALHAETAREREAIRQRAGQMTGLNAASASRRENRGSDSSRVEGFDESIADIMDEFPGALGNDPNEHESRLWDIIRAGAQPVKPAYHPDILAEATQIVLEQRQRRFRDKMTQDLTKALGDAFEPPDDDFVPREERWVDASVPFSMSSRAERERYRKAAGDALREQVRSAMEFSIA